MPTRSWSECGLQSQSHWSNWDSPSPASRRRSTWNAEWRCLTRYRMGEMAEAKSEGMRLVREQDVVLARQAIRKAAQQIGFSIVDQTKIVTAASELARNAVVYGGGGTLQWEPVAKDGRRGLRLTVIDEGPGIEDTTLAMKDGWTTGTGLGMGLPGAKRLVNEFKLVSKPGQGTTVTIT